MNYYSVTSPLCAVGAVWVNKDGAVEIIRLFLCRGSCGMQRKIKKAFPEARRSRDKRVVCILKDVVRYIGGKDACPDLLHICRMPHTAFRKRVVLAAKSVPRGNVISYKALAGRSGSRRAARAAASVMAENALPIIIPCHRIVAADRRIGDFQAGRLLKKRLLMSEGIVFDSKGKIPDRFFVGGRRC